MRAKYALIAVLCAALFVPGLAEAGKLDTVIQLAMQVNKDAEKSQKRIDAIHEDTQELLGEYRTVQRQLDSIKVYNRQLEGLIKAQEYEKVDIQRQIDDATMVAREITPLMLRMLDTLEQFVELDVPFLLEERRERIARLKEIMERADVTESEKFRQLLEAYQVENDYGRTIESYQGKLEGDERELAFLRVGRVVLVYQTLDGSEMGVWNQTERKWDSLTATYRGEIDKGFRMARKQAAPDLLRLPVPAPEVVQ